ncbi:MAG TPA: adenylate/guanylate cyclase domain-containing protein [Acidimicrobiales bacterium]|nr:adenylate/guanylate cyclase domain-containing protein [Acidimicrobiales bacterium]
MAAPPTGPVTLLFTDIEGSTRLLHELGDGYSALLERHHSTMRRAIERHGGYEVSTEGDAFFVVFAGATEAVAAALDVQRDLSEETTGVATPLRVRMGLHTGDVSHTVTGYVGMAIHEAARVASAANGGQVLATSATVAAGSLPEASTWTDLGEHTLKDIVHPVHLFQLAHPRLNADVSPPRSQGAAGSNLPEPLTSFVGRDDEVASLIASVTTERLVTIVGPGGAGKTRLSIAVAQNASSAFAGGVWFTDLSGASEHDDVASEIAHSLGADTGQSRLLDAVAEHIGRRHTLLVIDNCEHVIDGAAAAADALLSRCPELVVLATSREPLAVGGEAVTRIASLSDRDASALFEARARLVDPSFSLDAVAATVIGLCERLDHIPLAIELAAARLAVMPVEELAEQLDDRFRILVGRRGAAGARQRTLEATIAWSHDLLEREEQLVFRRLGVFASAFTLDAAEIVAAIDGQRSIVRGIVRQLASKSLIVVDGDGYRLLETMRAYARDRLEETGEVGSTRDRHLQWAVSVAREAEATIHQGGDAWWRHRLLREHADIEAAVEWALTSGHEELALEVTGALWWAWLGTTRLPFATHQLRASLDAAPAASLEHRLRAAIGEALFSFNMGDDPRFLDEAVALSGAIERASVFSWCPGLALALRSTAEFVAGRDDRETIATARAAVDLAMSMGHPVGLAFTYSELGRKLATLGEFDEGVAHMERGIEWARKAGTGIGVARGLNLLAGAMTRRAGDPRSARALDEELLEVASSIADVDMSFAAKSRLSLGAAADGDLARAVGLTTELVDLARRSRSAANLAHVLQDAGWYHHLEGHNETARQLLMESIATDNEDARVVVARYRLADTLRTLGEAEQAAAEVRAGFAVTAEAGDPGWLVAILCEEAAALAADGGDWNRAAVLAGAGSALREPHDEPFLGEAEVLAHAERAARAVAPTTEEYERQRSVGAAMSAAEASAFALTALAAP